MKKVMFQKGTKVIGRDCGETGVIVSVYRWNYLVRMDDAPRRVRVQHFKHNELFDLRG